MVPSNPDGSDFSLLSLSARCRLRALFFHLATVDIKERKIQFEKVRDILRRRGSDVPQA